jgi:hypothetical protein
MNIFEEEEEKIIDVFPELGGCGDNQSHENTNQNGCQSSSNQKNSCKGNCDCNE